MLNFYYVALALLEIFFSVSFWFSFKMWSLWKGLPITVLSYGIWQYSAWHEQCTLLRQLGPYISMFTVHVERFINVRVHMNENLSPFATSLSANNVKPRIWSLGSSQLAYNITEVSQCEAKSVTWLAHNDHEKLIYIFTAQDCPAAARKSLYSLEHAI